MIMAAPMIVLYEAGVLVARVVTKRKKAAISNPAGEEG
jgi:Sec-independent protein secretion pathway component TatC